MIKFTLKRRLSGKAIRKARRIELFGNYNKYAGTPLRSPKYKRRRVYHIGKEHDPTIYQLEDQHKNQTNLHTRYRTNVVNHGDWFAFRIMKNAKNPTQKERIYKLYPAHDPKVKREREHQKKVAEWQARLKKNELLIKNQ